MRFLLGLLVVSSILGPPVRAQTGAEPTAADAVRALDDWLTLYLAGKLDISQQDRMRGKVNQAKAFVSVKHGLTSERDVPRLDHVAELRLICAAIAQADDARAAAALLRVAAVGLDSHPYKPEMAPPSVRSIGEEFAAKLNSKDALDAMVAVATSGTGAARGSLARQAAALKVLGRGDAENHRALLHAGLAHAEADVRLGAADALVSAKLPASVEALAAAAAGEGDERVAVRILDALTATLGTRGMEVDEAGRSAALSAALGVLERHGWRAQLAACDTLAVARSARSVPVLIGVLERYHGRGARPVGSRASNLVPTRAHEVLRSLSGAVFGAEQPDQWRTWWEGAQATFVLAEARPAAATVVDDSAATSTAKFFGVPVTGTRVVFVVDISGSMNFPFASSTATVTLASTRQRSAESKWDVAERELQRALAALPAESSFNAVYLSLRADAWKAKVVAATAAHRKAFLADLAKRRPDGGTNVWAALQLALGMRTLGYGDPLANDIDELFVLSDGAPSVGEVVDPQQILGLVRAANQVNRVRINTIFIGSEDEEQGGRGPRFGISGVELMRRLAAENGGRFVRH